MEMDISRGKFEVDSAGCKVDSAWRYEMLA